MHVNGILPETIDFLLCISYLSVRYLCMYLITYIFNTNIHDFSHTVKKKMRIVKIFFGVGMDRNEQLAITAARLQEIRKALKLSIRKFSTFIEIAESTYLGYEKGRFLPKVDVLKRIEQKTQYSAAYILGESDHPGDFAPVRLFDSDHTQKVKVLRRLYTEIEKLINPQNIMKETTIVVDQRKETLLSVVMNDDGMQNERPGFPGIKKGDLVVFDYELAPQTGDIVVLKINGKQGFLIRRIVNDLGGSVTLAAENPVFPQVKIERKEIECMYTVVSRSSTIHFHQNN